VSKAYMLPREQWVDDWFDTSVTQQRYGTEAVWVPQWLSWLRDRNY